jgi:hypothetical protein
LFNGYFSLYQVVNRAVTGFWLEVITQTMGRLIVPLWA